MTNKPRIGVLMRDAYGLTVRINGAFEPDTSAYIRYSHATTLSGRDVWTLERMTRIDGRAPHLTAIDINAYDDPNYSYLELARQYLHAVDGWHTA